jgi:hypothetical protein
MTPVTHRTYPTKRNTSNLQPMTRKLLIFKLLSFVICWFLLPSPVSAQNPSVDWLVNYGTGSNEDGQLIAPGHDGDIYFAGSYSGTLELGRLSLSSTDPNIRNFICKMDKNRNALWAVKLDGPFSMINEISTDRNGHLNVVGNFADSIAIGALKLKSNGIPTSFLVTMDGKGKVLSSRIITSSVRPPVFSAYNDPESGKYLCGLFYQNITLGDKSLTQDEGIGFFIARLNQDGECESLKKLDVNILDRGHANFTWDLNGNCILLISQAQRITFNSAEKTLDGSGSILLKYGKDGTFLWSLEVPGIYRSGKNMAADKNDAIILAGRLEEKSRVGKDSVTNIYGKTDILVMKVGKEGQVIWKNVAGGAGEDICNAVCLDQKGNAYLTGKVQQKATFGKLKCTSRCFSDIFLARINPAGHFDWLIDLGGYPEEKEITPVAGNSNGNDCMCDPSGNLYFTGDLQNDLSHQLTGKNKLKCKGGTDIIVGKIRTTP